MTGLRQMWRYALILVLYWLLVLFSASAYAPGYITFGKDGGGSYENSYLRVGHYPGDEFDPHPVVATAESSMASPTGLPTFRGARPVETGPSTLTAWITHYSFPAGSLVASEHPEGFRPGMAAGYAVRDRRGRILSATLPGYGALPWGTRIIVEGIGAVEVWDTGRGMDDARPWLDVAVATAREAELMGSTWRRVWILE